MSLDRAIMLPHEFDKKEEGSLPDSDVSVEALDRWPRESDENLQNPRQSAKPEPNDGKRNE